MVAYNIANVVESVRFRLAALKYSRVAQLAEQQFCKLRVAGSIPVVGSWERLLASELAS